MLGVTAQWSGRWTGAPTLWPHAGEQRAREMQIHFLRIADARFVERLLYGQLRTDRTGRMRAEAGFLRLINLDEYDRLSPQKLPLLKNLMQMKKLDFRKSHRSSQPSAPDGLVHRHQ